MKNATLVSAAQQIQKEGGDDLLQRQAIARTVAAATLKRFNNKAANLLSPLPEEDILKLRVSASSIGNQYLSGDRKVKSHYGVPFQAYETKDEETEPRTFTGIEWALTFSAAGKERGVGCCTEFAAHVYCKLYQVSFRPFELVTLLKVPNPYSNHCLIALGLPMAFEDVESLEDYKQSKAVICDPWAKLWLDKRGKGHPDGVFTVAEYLSQCEDLPKNWSIRREYRLMS